MPENWSDSVHYENGILERQRRDSKKERRVKKPEYIPFDSAFLLVRSEDMAVVDRRVLRDAGVRSIQVLSSGVEAAGKLAEVASSAGSGPDMVLCHEQLADMSGDEFVRLVRLHPALAPFPVIMTVAADSPALRAKAREFGYSGLLIRPYTLAALIRQMNVAAECRAATRAALHDRLGAAPTAFCAALDAFSKQRLLRSDNADHVYRGALLALRQRNWDEAVTALQRAVRLAPENGEIVLALAAAWRGKNDVEKSRAMLREAVAVFVDSGAWERARGVSERLLNETGEKRHPLHNEARRLLASNRAADAANALIHSGFGASEAAAGPEGKSAWTYEQIARGCMASGEPVQTLTRLIHCLTAAWGKDCAGALESYVLSRINGAESPLAAHHLAVAGFTSSGPAFAGEVSSSQSVLCSPQAKHINRPPAQDNTVTLDEPAPVIPLLKEPSPSTALKGFPLLRDAVAVAKVTAGLLRAERKAGKK